MFDLYWTLLLLLEMNSLVICLFLYIILPNTDASANYAIHYLGLAWEWASGYLPLIGLEYYDSLVILSSIKEVLDWYCFSAGKSWLDIRFGQKHHRNKLDQPFLAF